MNCLTEEKITWLRQAVRPWYTEKRYRHVLAVEEEAASLGKLLLPEREWELRAAALLHDITKKYDTEKQLQYCDDFGIIRKVPLSVEVLHGMTGPYVAEREFPEYVNEDILSGIRWHTTGCWRMGVFESIIFLADYIEPTRTHETCISVRTGLYSALNQAKDGAARQKALDRAVVQALDYTMIYLIHKNSVIDEDTLRARNYFLDKKER